MNKNKIILIIIGIIMMVLILLVVLNSKSSNSGRIRGKSIATFDIWIMSDNKEDFSSFLDEFKKYNPLYKSTIFNVESFSNYEEYTYSLASAIMAGKAPDLFVLNNNESSIFENYTFGIESDVISINDFRKKYKTVFSNDLIVSIKSGDNNIELLKGIPVGYETLGIFYNRKRGIKSKDLSTLSSLSNLISKLATKYPKEIPLGIGNGKTVKYSSDIISQFFLFEKDVKGIDSLDNGSIRSGLSSYIFYGDISGTNKFDNSRFQNSSENNIDLFSDAKISMIVGYPRMINEIDNRGYGKNNLDAIIFPHDSSSDGKVLVNYNYFVINKDSQKTSLGFSLLKYLTTEDGITKYSENIPYYLPAIRDYEEKILENKINAKYNIILKDFYNEKFELSSFDKGIVTIFDKEIINILDMNKNFVDTFEEFNSKLKCKRDKFLKLIKLSKSCE